MLLLRALSRSRSLHPNHSRDPVVPSLQVAQQCLERGHPVARGLCVLLVRARLPDASLLQGWPPIHLQLDCRIVPQKHSTPTRHDKLVCSELQMLSLEGESVALSPTRPRDQTISKRSSSNTLTTFRSSFLLFNPASGQPLTITPAQLLDFCINLIDVVLQVLRLRTAASYHPPNLGVQKPGSPLFCVPLGNVFILRDLATSRLRFAFFFPAFFPIVLWQHFLHPLLHRDVLILSSSWSELVRPIFKHRQFSPP